MALSGLVDIHQYSANNRNVKVEYSASEDIPEYLIGDRFKINQIIANLLNNAIKFTKPGSTIWFRFEKGNTNWIISIKDEGKGISPEKLESIFDPYVTEKNRDNVEGTGIGLHNAQILVEALNGKITVDSELGIGSIFTVYLPIIESLPTTGANKEKHLDSTAGKVQSGIVL